MQQQPPVVAMAELIDMLGVSKSRVVQLIAMPDFPAPVAVLRVGKLWSYDDVRSWAERAGRTVHPISAR
jgi:predicted DNA-binding transcriptional regulator AlpA